MPSHSSANCPSPRRIRWNGPHLQRGVAPDTMRTRGRTSTGGGRTDRNWQLAATACCGAQSVPRTRKEFARDDSSLGAVAGSRSGDKGDKVLKRTRRGCRRRRGQRSATRPGAPLRFSWCQLSQNRAPMQYAFSECFFSRPFLRATDIMAHTHAHGTCHRWPSFTRGMRLIMIIIAVKRAPRRGVGLRCVVRERRQEVRH